MVKCIIKLLLIFYNINTLKAIIDDSFYGKGYTKHFKLIFNSLSKNDINITINSKFEGTPNHLRVESIIKRKKLLNK